MVFGLRVELRKWSETMGFHTKPLNAEISEILNIRPKYEGLLSIHIYVSKIVILPVLSKVDDFVTLWKLEVFAKNSTF